MRINRKKVKRVLFVTLSNLGDIILTTPVLEKICDEYPDARIDIVTGAPGKEIFDRHAAADKVIVAGRPKSLYKRIKRIISLRRERYDIVIDLKNPLSPYLLGARYKPGIIGQIKTSARIFFGKKSPGSLHKKDEHLARLGAYGMTFLDGAGFFLPVTLEDKLSVDKMIGCAGKRIVVLSPGAKSHLKRWPAYKYAELAVKLKDEIDCDIFIVGNSDDNEVVGECVRRAFGKVTDLCSKTSIGELASLMERAALVVTNDSAPMHIASAVGAPTIAIFGPSDERRYGPVAPKNKVIKPDKACRPCGRALCFKGPDEGCLPTIEVDEVFQAAEEMLAAR